MSHHLFDLHYQRQALVGFFIKNTMTPPKHTSEDSQLALRRSLQADIAVLKSNAKTRLGAPDFIQLCLIAGADLPAALKLRDEKIEETFGHLEALESCVFDPPVLGRRTIDTDRNLQ
jgi:hypothetical protein